MNFFKKIFHNKSMENKIFAITNEMKSIIQKSCKEKLWINWYGAYDIDPKNLVFWICVESDELKSKLESNGELTNELKNLLVRHDYPEQARRFVHIGFESQESVNRESNGNWYHHFK